MNEIPLKIRNSTSLFSFKQQHNENNIMVLVYYSSDNRLVQIHHTRLSSLNQHLNSNKILLTTHHVYVAVLKRQSIFH